MANIFRTKKQEIKQKLTSMAEKVSDEIMGEIALLAYKYWEKRGYQHGQDFNDWLRAEGEIKKKYNKK
jgi:hypothetical protein